MYRRRIMMISAIMVKPVSKFWKISNAQFRVMMSLILDLPIAMVGNGFNANEDNICGLCGMLIYEGTVEHAIKCRGKRRHIDGHTSANC